VLNLDGGPHLRCARCRAVYPSVWEGEELALATTLAEDTFEAVGETATLVVVQNLPSVYPAQKRKKQRKAKRRNRYPVALPAPIEIIDLADVPDEPEPVAEPPAPEVVAAVPKAVTPPVPAPLIFRAWVSQTPSRPTPPKRRKKPVRRRADDAPEYGRLQLNAAAILSLFLVAGALASVSIESVTGLVRPLAGVGVAIGLVAVVTSGLAGRWLLMPVTLAVVAAAIFVVSFAAPGILGPTYAASRQRVNQNDIQVLPHPQYARDPNVRIAEWVDASKASVRQGRFRVEVLHAGVGTGRPAGQPSVSKQYLLVHIRLHRHKTADEISAEAFAPPLLWPENVRATLWDTAGNRYEQQPVEAPRTAGPGHSSSSGPIVDATEEVLAFEIPPGSIKSLKLEVPAAAWGGPGTIKFAIPGSMIKR
jgi:hypothetical protein